VAKITRKSLKDVSNYVKVHEYSPDELLTAACAVKEWKREGRWVYGEPNEKIWRIGSKSLFAMCRIRAVRKQAA